MAFRVNHLNKKTGVTYVYEAVSVWDKEKKQSRNILPFFSFIFILN
jgi:hypothetical protein